MGTVALLYGTSGLGWEEARKRSPVDEVEEGPQASRIFGFQCSLAKAVGMSTNEEGQL